MNMTKLSYCDRGNILDVQFRKFVMQYIPFMHDISLYDGNRIMQFCAPIH